MASLVYCISMGGIIRDGFGQQNRSDYTLIMEYTVFQLFTKRNNTGRMGARMKS